MNIERLHEYCISKPFATAHFPFDEVTLVIKVGGKMFALIPLDATHHSISLKCDPELAIELREQYPSVRAAYHFNKKHWNQVQLDSSLPDTLIVSWVDHSYELVYNSLTRKIKEELKNESINQDCN